MWVSDFIDFIRSNLDVAAVATYQHLYLSFGSVLLGMLIAVPLGIWLSDKERLAEKVLAVTGTIQTVPGLAFLGLFLPLLGLGVVPSMTVLFLYSLLPILTNTYTGIRGVNPAVVEAGIGMGMSPRQLLFMVKLPLAFPVIIAGIRIASVYIVSWATLAAFVGGGGLGDPILTGIMTADINFILMGAIPAALLALAAGWILGMVERLATPRGLRG
ncbi:MAG: ABC transporter permease [Syntrophomonadaceae bacterium]|nr:ABC transporter permease [Syntrophomonadaceae bacterium]